MTWQPSVRIEIHKNAERNRVERTLSRAVATKTATYLEKISVGKSGARFEQASWPYDGDKWRNFMSSQCSPSWRMPSVLRDRLP